MKQTYLEKVEKAFREAGLTKLSEPVDTDIYTISSFSEKDELWTEKSFDEIVNCTSNFDNMCFEPTISAVIQSVKEMDNREYYFVNVACFNGVIAVTSSRGTTTWDGLQKIKPRFKPNKMNKARELAIVCWHTKMTNTILVDPSITEAVAKTTEPLLEKIKKLELSEELAWGLIANAYGGDWIKASLVWTVAAERWRDNYHDKLRSTIDEEA